MGNLFDELKKAKLIDKKKAKQLEHEQRVERALKGGDRALDAESEAKAKEHAKRQEEARIRDRQREKERQRAEQERNELLMLAQLVEARAIEARGSRRWHYVTASGAVPFLTVDENTARRLEGGELGIVTLPARTQDRQVIVPREVATKLEDKLSGSICFLAGR